MPLHVPDGTEDLVCARALPRHAANPDHRSATEVDDRVEFTSAFTDLRTGIPCRDRVGVLSILLADGVNLGLKKMAGYTHISIIRIRN